MDQVVIVVPIAVIRGLRIMSAIARSRLLPLVIMVASTSLAWAGDPDQPGKSVPAAERKRERIRRTLVYYHGGNELSEKAVAAGLDWLAKHQEANGGWGLDRFPTCNCNGCGMKNDVAGTAFGLLPFLGAGYTHQDGANGRHGKTVDRGLKFLLAKQGKDGSFGGMYEHALATMVLCEAYTLTADPDLREPVQSSLDYIVQAQHEAGGWRYGPRQAGDNSVTGWQVQALAAGRGAGAKVPEETFQKASRFLDNCFDPADGGYGYTGRGSTPTMTAAALLCRLELGWGLAKPDLQRGLRYLRATPASAVNLYHAYYATQVLHGVGGEPWDEWNPRVRDSLIRAQDRGAGRPHQSGSWDSKRDPHGSAWGRLGQTSLALLVLEVYYRADLRRASRPARPFKADEIDQLWANTAQGNLPAARRDLWTLVADPDRTVPFCKERLAPAKIQVDGKRLQRLVSELDDDEFAVREKASEELAKIGPVAGPALRKALGAGPSAEARRRIEALLAKLKDDRTTEAGRRTLRALEILEHVGTNQAREVLKSLAGGTPEAWLTLESQAAFERMGK
jgi:hypothetical protein